MKKGITLCLWFNNNAKEAVDFYLGVFKGSKIIETDHYTDVGENITGHKKGDILTIEFEVLDTRMLALNAGPEFKFSPAISLVIECNTQDEIDYYWEKLSYVPESEQCGWIQDKFGISWQIVPADLSRMLISGRPEQRKRVTEKYMDMKKFNIKELNDAFNAI
ncbi:MAG TPA: hypothetical protein DCQ16_00285 [Spirochaetaceae bacterium]|nr:hypothetical protein [Spirochaetaceae bacterium]